MKSIFKIFFGGKKEPVVEPRISSPELIIHKLSKDDLVRKELIAFNSKMNQFFSNPFIYTIENLSSDLGISPEEVLKKIKTDKNLSVRYNNILFSQKTTAEELLQMLKNNIPPDYKANFVDALDDPAFNLIYNYCLLEHPTIDYFKLQVVKKLSVFELNDLMEKYYSRNPLLKKDIENHRSRRLEEIKLDSLLNNNYSDY